MEKKVLLIEVGTDGTMRYIGELDDTGRMHVAGEISPATGTDNAVVTETAAPTAPVDESPRTAAAEAPASVAGSVNQGPVKLDPKDPNFESQKKELKAKGYRYVGKYQAWYPPREKTAAENSATPTPSQFDNWWENAPVVGLSKDDPDFKGKYEALKRAGFKWNSKLSLWENPQAQ